MALCANNCSKEAQGKSKYCSPSCKVAYNRNKGKSIETNRNNEAGPVQNDEVVIDANSNLMVISLEHYLANVIIEGQTSYAERTHPEKLNWGPRMDTADLASSPYLANRVPIPGDFDYCGVFIGEENGL